MIDNAKPLGH